MCGAIVRFRQIRFITGARFCLYIGRGRIGWLLVRLRVGLW